MTAALGSPRRRPAQASRRPRLAQAVIYALAAALVAVPPLADAFAEAGTRLEPVQLDVLGGGKAPLFSPSAKANVFVFIRVDQDRSIEALKQVAACEKELTAKGARFVVLVSGAAPPADVKAAVARAGTSMPILLDAGDKLYDTLQVRMHPVVGITDARGVIQAMEPFRQIDFGDLVRAHIRRALGEIDDAALAAVVNPAAAPMPGEDPVQKARRDVKMARKLIEFGQFDLAVKQAQKALEQAPVPDAFPVLAMAYAKLGRCAESKKMLAQAQSSLPDSPDLPEARALCAGK